jgi:hypothetical protein
MSIAYKKKGQYPRLFALVFFGGRLLPVVILLLALSISPEAQGQSTTEQVKKKQDIFKVILTVDGINLNTGDIITVVSVNGETKSKLFDDIQTYKNSIKYGGTPLVEYVSTFPNTKVKVGDEYKACVLLVESSQLICKTGEDSPSLRPENVDLNLQQDEQK